MILNAVARLRYCVAAKTSWITKRHLQALDEFQNYGSGGKFKSIGEKLFALAWPNEYLKVSGPLYRVMVVEKTLAASVWSGSALTINNVSSWSKSISISQDFIASHWFQDYVDKLKDPVVLLLKHEASQLRCIDIDRLHRDPALSQAVDDYDGPGGEGLEFRDSQQEVAVHRFKLSKSSIHQTYYGVWKTVN